MSCDCSPPGFWTMQRCWLKCGAMVLNCGQGEDAARERDRQEADPKYRAQRSIWSFAPAWATDTNMVLSSCLAQRPQHSLRQEYRLCVSTLTWCSLSPQGRHLSVLHSSHLFITNPFVTIALETATWPSSSVHRWSRCWGWPT